MNWIADVAVGALKPWSRMFAAVVVNFCWRAVCCGSTVGSPRYWQLADAVARLALDIAIGSMFSLSES